MTEEQLVTMLSTGGPLLLVVAAILAFLWPVRSAVVEWIKSKAAVLLALACFAMAGCGSYSQQRYDDLELIKGNTVVLVNRARLGKVSAVELRTALETIDKSLLAEKALLGKEADLEATRAKLLAESDAATAGVFDGDNGRD